MNGTFVTLWTARVAFLLYAAAIAGWLTGRPRFARAAWTAGFAVFLAHVAAAFQFQHHWSHAAAYADTARQTEKLFGTAVGSGLYWNYVFTVVWAVDVVRQWTGALGRRWIAVAVHTFMAFMFLNATVVFVAGWSRWMGVAVFAALGVLLMRRRSSRP